jgi:hypothetical protein
LANVLLPQDDQPSMVMMIFFISSDQKYKNAKKI